ncbi:MAG: HlyD family secretion protein [Fimbriiglobus sp.]
MLTRVALPLVAIAMLAFAGYQMTLAQQKAPPSALPIEPAKSPFTTQLAGAGIVEPESENISVGTNVPGIVDEVMVKVGMQIKAGDPIFRLDERALKAELQLREAKLASAEATEKKLAQQPRPEELPPLTAKVAEAEANLREQEKLYERYRKLMNANSISEDEFLRRESAFEVAKAQFSKAKADRDLTSAGAWAPDKSIANAAVLEARAMIAQTKTELERLTMKAPKPDVARSDALYNVLQVNVRPGEYVGSQPGQAIIVLGQVGKVHVRLDIDENDIARFSPTFPGVAKPRGNPKQEFALKFIRVEPYVIPKRSLTGGGQERVDTRVLQVIYEVDSQGRPLYIGQQMDVFLDTTQK